MSDSLWPHEVEHIRITCPFLSPRVCTNSCPLSPWWRLAISCSVPHSFLALNLFQHQSLFQWVGPSHQVAKYWSFSFSISPSNEYSGLISFRIDWFNLLVFRGLSRVFFSTTVRKHQFFSTQPSLWSNSHMTTGKTVTFNLWTFVQESDVSAFLIGCLGLS